MPNPNQVFPNGMDPRPVEPGELDMFTLVPAWYIVTVVLDNVMGAVLKGAEALRPNPFVLRRITWACTGDTLSESGGATIFNYAGSLQGRTVRVRFGDSFTTFVGRRSGFLSAAFGDSNGFLDMDRDIVFGGKQSLEVELNRVVVAGPADQGIELAASHRFDFAFAGADLLPKPVNQSGSE